MLLSNSNKIIPINSLSIREIYFGWILIPYNNFVHKCLVIFLANFEITSPSSYALCIRLKKSRPARKRAMIWLCPSHRREARPFDIYLKLSNRDIFVKSERFTACWLNQIFYALSRVKYRKVVLDLKEGQAPKNRYALFSRRLPDTVFISRFVFSFDE